MFASEGAAMKTMCGLLAAGGLFAQVATDATAPASTTWLEYGAPGALLGVLAIVFLRVLPAHQAQVNDVVKEHKEAVKTVVEGHERACNRLADEIKSWRVIGK